MTYRVAIDIGGTFTDLILLDEASGALRWHKVLTTPAAPADGALRGLRELCARAGITPAHIRVLIHATTLVTNAIIERTGAPTALLTTAGFRDTLEMGKEQRYDIYDLFLRYPEPLVPRRWRIDVRERLSRDGDVLVPVDLRAARRAIRSLVRQGVASVAVCFLHAYRNPVHEQLVEQLLRREFPALAVSISSEVSPEIREYERTCTTVCNAYVQPLVDRYLRQMEEALVADGFRGRFLLMLSSGTLAAPDVARRFPVRLLESGPAAGALLSGHIGGLIGLPDVVGFDMGGTTAKICLVRDGRPKVTPTIEVARVHRFKPGSGLPVKTPVVDMIEIGAGGGSLAGTDSMGLLRVGPHSAGADPGPACYGLGGTEATVTDACVVLGYFDPSAFLGGTMRLDATAARAVVSRVGAPLGLSPVETAWGIFAIVCENMAQAGRLYLIERGQDPRRFALLGFGGAGPAAAAHVARLLGMRQAIIPPASGLASALGLLVAPPGFDFGHSLAGELQDLNWEDVERLFAEMESRGRTMVAAAGASAAEVRSERRAEMRYTGQFHDIEVPLPARLPAGVAALIRQRFDAEYRRLYGMALDEYPVQALNWRVLVSAPGARVDLREAFDRAGSPGPALRGHRPIYLSQTRSYVDVPVYARYLLAEGAVIDGPAVIEEGEATTLLWPADQATVDPQRNLIVHVDGQRRAASEGASS
jgi:5-oxoprolinase (ATP-hydrolysing)/N-methylhydantoinase A